MQHYSSFQLITYHCQRVILAIPPSEAAKINFTPVLPDFKRQLFAGFPQGNLLKFIITYPRPFWKDQGFSGEIAATGLTDKSHVV